MLFDRENTYFLIEDSSNGILYRMPLNALGNIIAMNNEENAFVNQLIDTIDLLSSEILELSAEMIEEHYSKEELSTIFELKSDVDYLLIDRTILTEEDAEKFAVDSGKVLKETVDSMYDEEETDSEDVFDKVEQEQESYLDTSENIPEDAYVE